MKTNDPLEKDIEKSVCAYAKRKGLLCYKFNSASNRAIPDRIFINKNAVVFFIEFKRKGKKPTPLQRKRIEQISKQGVNVFVVDNIETGKKTIDMFVWKD